MLPRQLFPTDSRVEIERAEPVRFNQVLVKQTSLSSEARKHLEDGYAKLRSSKADPFWGGMPQISIVPSHSHLYLKNGKPSITHAYHLMVMPTSTTSIDGFGLKNHFKGETMAMHCHACTINEPIHVAYTPMHISYNPHCSFFHTEYHPGECEKGAFLIHPGNLPTVSLPDQKEPTQKSLDQLYNDDGIYISPPIKSMQ